MNITEPYRTGFMPRNHQQNTSVSTANRIEFSDMTIKKSTFALMLMGLGSLLVTTTATPASLAQPADEGASEHQLIKSSQPRNPLRQGLPGRRLGGGTRSERLFKEDYAYLAALVTSNNLGITTAARPTLMFYVPEMVANQTAEFELRDENDNLVHASIFEVDSNGGIIRLDTAELSDIPLLSIDATYRWYFSIVPAMTNATDRASDIVVHGNIRRVEQSAWLSEYDIDAIALEQASQASPVQQARLLYQEANLWHDAAVLLTELQQQLPNSAEVETEWNQLLESAGLAAIVETAEPATYVSL